MNLSNVFQKLSPNTPILQATFGLERESLRINTEGRVAQTPHPEKLGSRSFHPYIQTDYSEPQLELITPVAQSTTEARRFLGPSPMWLFAQWISQNIFGLYPCHL
ncbi:bifunctional glutamate--cysteine ligase-glutathione synthetase [Streptococcus sp. ZB199]|nr:bifunctional glutamate--cysteine ligase-glutathione synthetase [Streptococcus sp. ZB199]